MALNKIILDVETRDLKIGDAVVWNNGEVYFLAEPVPTLNPHDGSEYVTLTWRENGPSTFTSTAQPWNTWPTVIRAV